MGEDGRHCIGKMC